MKKEEKKETKKTRYEKPVLTKIEKLTNVVAGTTTQSVDLGCTRF